MPSVASRRVEHGADMFGQEGNTFFKEGKFVEALAKYEEAMKRNPKDHVPYSNRYV